MLDARQVFQRALRPQAGMGRVQARPHHPVQDQRHEADLRVGADALGQTVVHRADLDFGLEYPRIKPRLAPSKRAENGAQLSKSGGHRAMRRATKRLLPENAMMAG